MKTLREALIKRDKKYKYIEHNVQPKTMQELESFDVIKCKNGKLYIVFEWKSLNERQINTHLRNQINRLWDCHGFDEFGIGACRFRTGIEMGTNLGLQSYNDDLKNILNSNPNFEIVEVRRDVITDDDLQECKNLEELYDIVLEKM